jgi:Stress-induced bacterial acidophilic repeat motif.
MPNRPGSDDRTTPGGLGDRGGQRDSNENARQGGTAGVAQSGSTRSRSNRGFASMDRGKQKEIASKGGKAAHAKGTAHEFDSSEAREAGRKGGVAVSRNREHMAAIGRRGGEARGHSRTRASVHANTGATDALSGSYQNTRQTPTPGSAADRQVDIENEPGVSANPQGTRGGSSSLGGERRSPNAVDVNNTPPRNEAYGNH